MLKIRLARCGLKRKPFYRIVVANVTSPRDGKFIEIVGTYDPMLNKDHEKRIVLNIERIKYWKKNGAQATDTVKRFLIKANIS